MVFRSWILLGLLGLGSGTSFAQTEALQYSLQPDGSLGNTSSGIPALSQSNKIFLRKAGIWISGLDQQERLYVAAQNLPGTQASDLWPGPMDTLLIKATRPEDWNRTWTVNSDEISLHRKSWSNPNYQTPNSLKEWPAQGKENTARVLAPYADSDFDGNYNPENGDFPFIPGNTVFYAISNDEYDEHQVSKAAPLKIELQTMLFTVKGADSVIFLRYTLFNRSSSSLKNLRLSFVSELTLGNPFDNGFFSDSTRHCAGAWNLDHLDEGLSGFGGSLPWFLVSSLNKPLRSAVLLTGENDRRYPLTDQEFRNIQEGKFANGNLQRNVNHQETHFSYSDINWPDTSTGLSKFSAISVELNELLPGQGNRWDIALCAGTTSAPGMPSTFTNLPFTLQTIYAPYANNDDQKTRISSLNTVQVFPTIIGHNSMVNIHSKSAIRAVRMLDGLGRIVYEKTMDGIVENHLIIQPNEFQNSSTECLFLQIETSMGISTKRVILMP